MNNPLSRLLVPLDGSEMAEAVLPAAEGLGARFGSRIILIHVLEKRPPATVHGERHLLNPSEAEEYLSAVALRLTSAGIEVETHVHEAPEQDLVGSVVKHIEEYTTDLVLLCAHGRGGLRALLFGRIAQQVLNRGATPVFMVQPGASGTLDKFEPHRVLVPLDGRHEAQPALDLAATFARAYAAELHLVLVVPTMETLSPDRAASAVLLPSTTRESLAMDAKTAGAYLEELARRYTLEGVSVRPAVLRGDAATALLEHAAGMPSNLIVMPSHGRTGLKTLFARGVAERVSAEASSPLVLVRA